MLNDTIPVASQMTEEAAALYLLGITPADLIGISKLDQMARSKLWKDASQKLVNLTNPAPGDSPSVKVAKSLNKEFGYTKLAEYVDIVSGIISQANSTKFAYAGKVLAEEIKKQEDQVLRNPVLRIGRMRFGPDSLDADDLRISETYSTVKSGALRSETEVTYRDPRSMTRITVDMTFAGADAINNKLRPLLAELKVSPLTTIESPFLADCLINQYASPEIVEELRNRVLQGNSAVAGEIDRLVTEAGKTFQNVRDLLASNDIPMDYIHQRLLNQKLEAGAKTNNPNYLGNGSNDNLLTLGIVVPVVVMDVILTTDTKMVDTLHVRFVFLRYNSSAFGMTGLQFMDKNGEPTPDIEQCPWIQKYAKMVYLDTTDQEVRMEEYFTSEQTDFHCEWSDHVDGVDENGNTKFKSFPSEKVLQNGKFVIESVQASFGTSIAALPIIGSKYPTIQIMGQQGVTARVILATTSKDLLRELHLMKDNLDAIARRDGGYFRDERVIIENSVLNMLGARQFVIANIETLPYPDTSNAFQVEVTLVPAQYGKNQQQKLEISPSGVSEKDIKEIWDYLYERYLEYLNSPVPLEDFKNDKTLSRDTKLAIRYIFGDGSGNQGKAGVLNNSLLLGGLVWYYHRLWKEPTAGQLRNGALLQKTVGDMAASLHEDPTFLVYANAVGTPGPFRLTGPTTTGRGLLDGDRDPLEFGRALNSIILEAFEDGATTDISIGVADGWIFHSGLIADYRAGGETLVSILSRYLAGKEAGKFFITRGLWDAMWDLIIHNPDAARTIDTDPDEIENWDKFDRGSFTNSESMWSVDHIAGVQQNLYSLVTSGDIIRFENLPLTKRLLSKRDKVTYLDTPNGSQIESTLKSNYPDLRLPTYRQIFSDENGKLIQFTDGSFLWKRFSPRYIDLGIVPELDVNGLLRPHEAMLDVARVEDDPVEPVFWLWTSRVKDRLAAKVEKTLDTNIPVDEFVNKKTLQRQEHVISVDVNTEEMRGRLNDFPAYSSALKETINSMIEKGANNFQKKFSDIRKGKFKQYDIIDREGNLCAIVEPSGENRGPEYKIRVIKMGAPIVVNSSLGVAFDRNDGPRMKGLMKDIIKRTKDIQYSPVRHYPAFRLYFVEFDNEVGRNEKARLAPGTVVRMIDDLYTTNAVLSIHITHSKRDASTAVIQVLNTEGTFDADEFLTEAEAKKRNIEKDDAGESFLRRMKLKYGTGIMIKMGYSSNPAELDTVFTGQIVELGQGSIIEIIAQSYKTEMFQEVSLYEGNANARVVMHKLLTKMPLPHFGRIFDTRGLTRDGLQEVAGGVAAENAESEGFGISGQRGVLSRVFGSRYTTSTRNIFFESNFDIRSSIGEVVRDIGEYIGGVLPVPYLTTPDHYWYFDRMTLWDAFDEISRHYPGHVCDVRPSDTEATLFFGPPEQHYLYRQQTFKEKYIWLQYLNYVQPYQLNQIATNLIGEFSRSDWGTTESKTDEQWLRYLSMNIDGKRKALQEGNIGVIWPSYTAFKRQINQTSHEYNHPTLLHTTSINFTPEWEKINSYPGLARYLTAMFFGLRHDDWKGFETVFKKFSSWMGPLTTKNLSLVPGAVDNKYHTVIEEVSFRHSGDLTTAGEDFLANTTGVYSSISGLKYSEISSRAADPNPPNPDLVEGLGDITSKAPTLQEEIALLEWEIKLEPATPPASGATTKAQQRRLVLQELVQALNELLTKPDDATLQARVARLREEAEKTSPRVMWRDGSVADIVTLKFPLFRVFIYYFGQFLGSNTVPADKSKLWQTVAKQLGENIMPPGYKVFRNYHMVSDKNDIIMNEIHATTREMANTVMLRCPSEQVAFDDIDSVDGSPSTQVLESDQSWVYFPNALGLPFHPDIDASSRILRTAQEPNANRKEAQAACLMSHMGLALRPMYRGQLKIVGRDIWPWDIIFLNDDYNMMYGPVEADTVVHEFTRDTGWVTTIEPHAFVSVSAPSDKFLTSAAFDAMSGVSSILTGLEILSWGLMFVPALGAASIAVRSVMAIAAKTAMKKGALAAAKRFAVRSFKKTVSARRFPEMFSTMLKMGGKAIALRGINSFIMEPAHNVITNIYFKMNFNGELWPVDVLPLVHRGMPMYAGVTLSDREIFSFWQALRGSLKDTWKSISEYFDDKDYEANYSLSTEPE
jgi:hypothetical protein